jgi:hypothetical protein
MKIQKALILLVISAVILTGCQEINSTSNNTAAHSEAETMAYTGALKFLDIGYCEKIDEQEFKEKCNLDVKDAIFQKEAVNNLDESLCKSLSSEDKKESCKTKIQIRQRIDNEKVLQTTNEKAYTSIVENGAYENCDSLEDQSLVELCKNNKIFSDAISNKDISLCKNLAKPDLVIECEKVYNETSSIKLD